MTDAGGPSTLFGYCEIRRELTGLPKQITSKDNLTKQSLIMARETLAPQYRIIAVTSGEGDSVILGESKPLGGMGSLFSQKRKLEADERESNKLRLVLLRDGWEEIEIPKEHDDHNLVARFRRQR